MILRTRAVSRLEEIRNFIDGLVRNRLWLTYNLSSSSHYWSLLSFWQRLKFRLSRTVYETSSWVQFQRESFSILTWILQIVAGQLLMAIVVVGILAYLNPFLIEYLKSLLPSSGVYSALTGILNKLEPDRQASINVVTALAQVAAVFLGLYFTAIGVVASTAYVDAPADVRSLLIQEKVGNRYMRLLALFGGVCLVLLIIETLDYRIGILNFLLVSVMGLVVVFSFVALGTKAFDFFSPVSLIRYLGQDIAKWMQSASPSGFQWNQPSFQAHYQRRTENSLQSYHNIVNLATVRNRRGITPVELAIPALRLLQLYSFVKTRIPTDSQWFKRTPQFSDWLASGYTELDLALRTSTSIQPKLVPNITWFENKVNEIIVDTLQMSVRDDLQNALSFVGDNATRTLATLSSNFAIDESFHLFRLLWQVIGQEIEGVQSAELPQKSPGRFEQYIALIDASAFNLLTILLSFSERIGKIGPESLHRSVDAINWKKQRTIYIDILPRRVLRQLENLRSTLETELKVEGKIITPLWYQEQIVAIAFAHFLSDTITRFVAEMRFFFDQNSQALIAKKQYFFAAQVIARGLEGCAKLQFHRREWEQWLKRLESDRRVSDIPWPKFDWNEIDFETEDIRRKLVIRIGSLAPQLAIPRRPKDQPDYFGHAYNILAEQIYDAMASGDLGLFQSLFPSFFNCCFIARQLVLSQKTEFDDRTLAILSTEPIMDLLELSGYAILYSQLDAKNKQIWPIAKREWDSFVRKFRSKESARQLSDMVMFRDAVFAPSQRDIIRTKWQQRFAERLRTLGLLEAPLMGRDRELPKHGSALIRVAASHAEFSMHFARDVFIAMYLMKRKEYGRVEWPRQAVSLAKSLQRVRSENSDLDYDD
jgi:hypothetical protein